jgi:hypothetical protein
MSAIVEEGDEKEENKKGMRDLENITDKIKVALCTKNHSCCSGN